MKIRNADPAVFFLKVIENEDSTCRSCRPFLKDYRKCVRHLHFNGINDKTTNITLEVSSNATLASMSRRAKMHVKHARTAEVFTNTEIALPRWVGTTKKCARRRRRERQFWFFEHPQWNNAMSKKYTFMQWISLFFETSKICYRFLNTPSKIHASDLPLAKFKVARHYVHCDSPIRQAIFH